MEISINALTERTEDFLRQWAGARYRHQAGVGKRPLLAKLIEEFPELTRHDTFLQVRQACENARIDADRKASLQRLLRLLAWIHPLGSAAASLDETAVELEKTVTSSLRTMPLADALGRIPDDGERERRHALERDTSDALWERQTPWARVIDATIHSSSQLGFHSVRAQYEALWGVPLQGWLEAAEKLLLTTEDAYRDLLGYALKRLDPQLKPQAARWHDLQHLGIAPWMREHFRTEELTPAVRRTLEDLGLHPNANGRLQTDTEDREGKASGAHVAVLQVPDEVRLTLSPRGGLQAYSEALSGFGEAQLWANGPRTGGPLEKRLPDPALVQAIRMLFSHFLSEEGWHKRFLRLPSPAAREAARIYAFTALAQLRASAALFPYALEVFSRGPVRPLAEEYEDRLARALCVGVPRGGFLLCIEGVDPERLRAATLEVALSDTLRERFNEDFWRNPSTGKWFEGFAGRVGTEATRPEPSGLTRASQRLVRVMGT